MPRPSTKQLTTVAIIIILVILILKIYSLFDDYRFLQDASYKNFPLIWIHVATNLIEPVYVAVTVYSIPRQEFDILIDKQLESTWMYFRHKSIFIV